MFSKLTELAGLVLVAWGLAWAIAVPAGLIFGGIALLAIGSTIDDASVFQALRRGTGWGRYFWYRQIARENGVPVPDWQRSGDADGWVACECGGNEDCPLCLGSGVAPDPKFRENAKSPHPPIKVNPQAEEFWSRKAKARAERSRLRDRTPALSRPPRDDLERLA